MKHRLLSLIFAALLLPLGLSAQDFINLTPKARSMQTTANSVELPAEFTISHNGLTADEVAEITRFCTALKEAAEINATVAASDADALMSVEKLENGAAGNYQLTVDNNADTKVRIAAADQLGLYYALQTIKKILPANVMAGKKDARIKQYVLPGCTIDDGPRFAYRGFMLDVARHFFTVEEVKRMLDVMAYYKMNRFHWHLSDDQGWRVEIKKYPKLTTIGATASNSYQTDLKYGAYWTNKQYGPYFYTQEEIKEVVAYAKERHIEIIPEIDMPGHFVAALAAYPEYSCNPQNPPTVWINGGISSTVLNVANPAAVQFAKDVLSELMQLFPYEYMHIGGDECPTSEWAANAQCQALKEELGLTNDRQLQSHFIKQMADFVKENGRKLVVWNEAITASGADTKTIKETGATVFCWQPAAAGARKAAELGLDNVYTPWGPYYINRQQNYLPHMESLPGNGSDHVKSTYNEEAVPTDISAAMEKHYTGVQGTFWTEHIGDADMMEYMALPRLMAIAEAGWTPKAGKNFADFQKRIAADSVLLNYGHYSYCDDFMVGDAPAGSGSGEEMVMPKTSTDAQRHYYRIVTRATDNARVNRCWELLADGSPLIEQYAGKGAAAGLVWSNAQAAQGASNFDAQWWAFEENPEKPGHYALVCKAKPQGSLNATPTANSNTGRWKYDETTKHYSFLLGEAGYGLIDTVYYYSIRSENISDNYVNCAGAGQGISVNLWANPADGNGGLWSFVPEGKSDVPGEGVTPFDYLVEGKQYRFTNAVEGYDQTAVIDNATATLLANSTALYQNDAWIVEEAKVNSNGSQTMLLKNAATGRYMGAPLAYKSNLGYPVTVAETGAEVTIAYQPETADYRISVANHAFVPVSATAPTNPGSISSGSSTNESGDAVRPAGAAWNITAVLPVTLICKDSEGKLIATYTQNAEEGKSFTVTAPAVKHHEAESYELNGTTSAEAPTIEALTEAQSVVITYKRKAFAVSYTVTDTKGALIATNEVAVPVGESHTVSPEASKYFTLVSCEPANGSTLTPTEDIAVSAVYTTDAYSGIKAVGQLVTTPEADKSYLIYDASPANNGARKGYRCVTSTNSVNRVRVAEGAKPGATWTLKSASSAKSFRVLNDYADLYVPTFGQNENPKVGKTPGTFTFTLNADGTSFKIQGTNGQCWDGQENGNLVGWNAPGHPHEIYTYFVEPYFGIELVCIDKEGKKLSESFEIVKAGDAYSLAFPTIEGYTFESVSGNENFEGTVEQHYVITATYAGNNTGIGSLTETPAARKGIYDLSGRKLLRIGGPGIYVIDGKKIVVR